MATAAEAREILRLPSSDTLSNSNSDLRRLPASCNDAAPGLELFARFTSMFCFDDLSRRRAFDSVADLMADLNAKD